MSIASKKLMSIKSEDVESTYKEVDVKTEDDILLLTEPKASEQIYRDLNIRSQTSRANEVLKKVRELKATDKKFNDDNPSFRGEHLKKLCNKYDLQVLVLSKLKGLLKEDCILAIDNFAKLYDKSIAESSFYILAPRSYFKEDFKNKECSNFIILYRDPKYRNNSITSAYATIEEHTILTQVYSTGGDFKNIRKFRKYVSKDAYTKDNFSKRGAIKLFTMMYLVSIIPLLYLGWWVYLQIGITATYVLCLILNYTDFDSDNYWNEQFTI